MNATTPHIGADASASTEYRVIAESIDSEIMRKAFDHGALNMSLSRDIPLGDVEIMPIDYVAELIEDLMNQCWDGSSMDEEAICEWVDGQCDIYTYNTLRSVLLFVDEVEDAREDGFITSDCDLIKQIQIGQNYFYQSFANEVKEALS